MDSSLVVPTLEATPGLLRSLTRDCPGERAWTAPRPGDWSMGAVLRHLVEGDRDTFLPRLRRMVEEDRPVFEQRGPRAEGARDLLALLAAFETARTEALRILGARQPRLAAPGREPEPGPDHRRRLRAHHG
jgi:hypothetical protein